MANAQLVPSCPIKWWGAKYRIAKWIHKIAKPIEGRYTHRVYVFGGGGGEFWNWAYEGVSEVFNDIDFRLTNFFAVLQDESMFKEFLRKAEAVPFSEPEWNEAHFINQIEPPVEWRTKPDKKVMMALAFFVDCRQSLTGRMESFAPLSKRRTRRGMNEQASAWLGAIEGLPAVHRRLTRMAVRNVDWEKLIDQEDTEDTLFYLDPPYLPETRVATEVYKHEFDFDSHVLLLRRLNNLRGKFMLSGYHSHLYDEWALNANHQVHELVTDTKSGHGKKKSKRTEVIWTNF